MTDTVNIKKADLGDVTLSVGSGDDTMTIGDVNSGRSEFDSIAINAGGGSDIVEFKYSDVTTPSNIRMGGGADRLNVSLLNLDGGLDANGGGGMDSLSIADDQAGVQYTNFETFLYED